MSGTGLNYPTKQVSCDKCATQLNQVYSMLGLFLVSICGDEDFLAEIDVEKIIHPPSYPQSYRSTMNCWYSIVAPEKTRIRFWVDDFGSQIKSSSHYLSVRKKIV